MSRNFFRRTPNRVGLLFVLFIAPIFTGLGHAADASPAGLWQSIDDKTGNPRAEIRVSVSNGVAEGRIVRSLVPGEDPNALCTLCPGDRKDKPIIGMAILTGLKPSTSNPQRWEGGEILDPESGEIYRARIVLSPDGTEMDVRGFFGISLFGRSQTWLRKGQGE